MWEPFLPRIHHFNGASSNEERGKCFQILIILTEKEKSFSVSQAISSTLRFLVFRLAAPPHQHSAGLPIISCINLWYVVTKRRSVHHTSFNVNGIGNEEWANTLRSAGLTWSYQCRLVANVRSGDSNRLTSCQYFWSLSLLNLINK